MFLAPVQWQEDGWFTAGDGGVVNRWMEAPLEAEQQNVRQYDFSAEKGLKDMRWIYLRDPREENYGEEEGAILLRGTSVTLDEADSPTFVGVRQSEFDTQLRVTVSGAAAEAGITFYMDESQHYDLARVTDERGTRVILRLRVGDAVGIAGELAVAGPAKLEVCSDAEWYEFFCYAEGVRKSLGRARTKYLSSEVAGGFTGVVMGLYAVDGEGRSARFEGLNWRQGK
ncbi:MAG: hypothetical protein NC517_13535 [Firmicutes bacterium]|nr:hypothetical protein [Bacillota bacterium]